MDTIRKAFSADTTVNDGERSVTAVIATAALDRDGEVLIPQGCNSAEFERNPVVFWHHDYAKPPVGKCVAIRRLADAIEAKTVFPDRPDGHVGEWFPDTVLSLYRAGVLSGFSVGLLPVEVRRPSKKDIGTWGDGLKRVVSKWKLLEYSVAPLPVNQEALTTAVGKGIITAAVCKSFLGIEVPSAPEQPEPAAEPVPAKSIGVRCYVLRRPVVMKSAPIDLAAMVRREMVIQQERRKGRLYLSLS